MRGSLGLCPLLDAAVCGSKEGLYVFAHQDGKERLAIRRRAGQQ